MKRTGKRLIPVTGSLKLIKHYEKRKHCKKSLMSSYSEIDWLEKEYHSCIAESYGLFTWKKIPEHDATRPFFRLESELKIRKLQECVEMFNQWEASFKSAFSNLEREFPSDKRDF